VILIVGCCHEPGGPAGGVAGLLLPAQLVLQDGAVDGRGGRAAPPAAAACTLHAHMWHALLCWRGALPNIAHAALFPSPSFPPPLSPSVSLSSSPRARRAGAGRWRTARRVAAAAVSHSCACIGSACLRHCVHGASVGGEGGQELQRSTPWRYFSLAANSSKLVAKERRIRQRKMAVKGESRQQPSDSARFAVRGVFSVCGARATSMIRTSDRTAHPSIRTTHLCVTSVSPLCHLCVTCVSPLCHLPGSSGRWAEPVWAGVRRGSC
jgi:hypothetical protein